MVGCPFSLSRHWAFANLHHNLTGVRRNGTRSSGTGSSEMLRVNWWTCLRRRGHRHKKVRWGGQAGGVDGRARGGGSANQPTRSKTPRHASLGANGRHFSHFVTQWPALPALHRPQCRAPRNLTDLPSVFLPHHATLQSISLTAAFVGFAECPSLLRGRCVVDNRIFRAHKEMMGFLAWLKPLGRLNSLGKGFPGTGLI